MTFHARGAEESLPPGWPSLPLNAPPLLTRVAASGLSLAGPGFPRTLRLTGVPLARGSSRSPLSWRLDRAAGFGLAGVAQHGLRHSLTSRESCSTRAARQTRRSGKSRVCLPVWLPATFTASKLTLRSAQSLPPLGLQGFARGQGPRQGGRATPRPTPSRPVPAALTPSPPLGSLSACIIDLSESRPDARCRRLIYEAISRN